MRTILRTAFSKNIELFLFVRNRSLYKNQMCILSKDTKLSEIELVHLYDKRWDIERFFNGAKSKLALCKEFQCCIYDVMVCQLSSRVTSCLSYVPTKRKISRPLVSLSICAVLNWRTSALQRRSNSICLKHPLRQN